MLTAAKGYLRFLPPPAFVSRKVDPSIRTGTVDREISGRV